MKTLRIATRNSPLALWQAQYVAARLDSEGIATQLVPLVSGGDTDMRPIDGTRQVGVFTKRIQQALLEDEADLAVHSLKDLPTEIVEPLVLAAVPQREVIDDSLVSPQGWTLDELPTGARVGTGSRRRGAQLLHARPDLQILPIRGNVQTRLAKLDQGEFDAIILAEAGVLRLGMNDLSRCRIPRSVMLPAPGQGALGIEVRADDREAIDAVSRLDHMPSHAAVLSERGMLAALHGGCLAPIAALAELCNGQLTMTSVVLSSDGKHRIDQQASIPLENNAWRESAEALADEVSQLMKAAGAVELIEQHR